MPIDFPHRSPAQSEYLSRRFAEQYRPALNLHNAAGRLRPRLISPGTPIAYPFPFDDFANEVPTSPIIIPPTTPPPDDGSSSGWGSSSSGPPDPGSSSDGSSSDGSSSSSDNSSSGGSSSSSSDGGSSSDAPPGGANFCCALQDELPCGFTHSTTMYIQCRLDIDTAVSHIQAHFICDQDRNTSEGDCFCGSFDDIPWPEQYSTLFVGPGNRSRSEQSCYLSVGSARKLTYIPTGEGYSIDAGTCDYSVQGGVAVPTVAVNSAFVVYMSNTVDRERPEENGYIKTAGTTSVVSNPYAVAAINFSCLAGAPNDSHDYGGNNVAGVSVQVAWRLDDPGQWFAVCSGDNDNVFINMLISNFVATLISEGALCQGRPVFHFSFESSGTEPGDGRCDKAPCGPLVWEIDMDFVLSMYMEGTDWCHA